MPMNEYPKDDKYVRVECGGPREASCPPPESAKL